jgi:hypothetical protein
MNNKINIDNEKEMLTAHNNKTRFLIEVYVYQTISVDEDSTFQFHIIKS